MKIKAGKTKAQKTGIVSGGYVEPPGTLTFSFRYIDTSNDKFITVGQSGGYFSKVISRLKDLSTITEREFLSDRGGSLKSHPIDWRDTSEPDGFRHLNEQLQAYTPYQFAVSRNEHGRIHGFLIGSVFHIVWLDPEHKLYS